MLQDNKFEELVKRFKKIFGTSLKKTEQKIIDFIYSPLLLQDLQTSLKEIEKKLSICPTCGAIALDKVCVFCTDKTRSESQMCVVENYSNATKIAGTNIYNGMFHVLTGLLNVKNTPEKVNKSIEQLVTRVKNNTNISEVIIATPATMDGEFTAHMIKRKIMDLRKSLKVTMLAKGIPLGGSLDYVDTFTLKTSLENRR